MKIYSTREFTYDGRSRCFIAEASELDWKRDQVMRLRSARTGRIETFAFLEEKRNWEGEVVEWRYVSGATGLEIRIMND